MTVTTCDVHEISNTWFYI